MGFKVTKSSRWIGGLAATALIAGCNDGQAQPSGPAAQAPPPAGAPVGQLPPEASGQRPAVPGQTRIAQQRLGVAFRTETLATGLDHPWSLAFLPDRSMLITERAGALRRFTPGRGLGPRITGVPAVLAQGQGGLLDVVLAPDFATSRRIYLSYFERRPTGAAITVARATLGDAALTDVTVIFRAEPAAAPTPNLGGRMTFGPDGKLYVTIGDRFDRLRGQAQQLDSDIGKIVRLNPDGSAPADNPFRNRPGARPEIWSIGHRNPQAIAFDPAGQLWTVEHGARGGDELNRIGPGLNYGWPVISYGEDYAGTPIGEGLTAREGMEQPVYYWDPVIAPSGMAFYTGDLFPAWRGSLFVGGLRAQSLTRLTLTAGRVTGEERLLTDLNARIRDVRQGPDGALYVLTDEDEGRLIRLAP